MADALHLDRVLWIPAGDPPHKRDTEISPARVRLAMACAACASDPRFEVSAIEVERPGPSFMVDTGRELARRFSGDELFLILGADQFRSFGTWCEPVEIVRLLRLAVMDRGGESAVRFRDQVPGGAAAVFVPVRRVDLSSTDVRVRARRGEDIGALVPTGVRAIIEREGLYSASTRAEGTSS